MRAVYGRLVSSRDALTPGEPLAVVQAPWLPADRGAVLLDAACGAGRSTRAWLAAGYTRVVGVDLLLRHETPGFPYVVGDLRRLPLADDRFDFAFVGSALYYLPDPRVGLRELSRVLRPGGTLLFTAHTRRSPASLWRRLKRAFGLPSAAHLRDARFETAATYARWAEACGFRLVAIDGYGPSGRLHRLVRALVPTLVEGPPRWLARVRAELAYHTVIVARKLGPRDAA